MRLLIALAVFCSLAFTQSLDGIVDIHMHGLPDSQDWKIDVLETARLAKAAGMRAIVLKSHNAPTGQVAYLARQVVPGIQIFGGLALNRPVGGLNAAAIEQQVGLTGKPVKIVWMPTYDAENNVRGLGEKRPFISIAREGKLLPETVDILKVIAREQLILATGHSSAAEDLLLVEEAHRLGIARVVVTHPLYYLIHMSTAQMQKAAAMGGYLELCGNALLPNTPMERKLNVSDYAKAIREVGAAHIILSSDLGQTYNHVHTDGWKEFLAMFEKAGVTKAEIDQMARKNPAALLGLN